MQQTFVFNRTGGLENADFSALGFKCGLEIHHQIKTEKKLFCRCPAGKYSDEYQAEILRHMRPTLSELGEYDGTALMEFKTKKEIVYRLNKDSVCTYELDDNPPFPVNRQAVDIALEIALLLNCKIVSEIHIARKQYLDGSIPTGFQRTTIIGVDGWIPYKDRKIGVIQLALEEDACREVSDRGHRIVFLTDRLSMPLIEVVTAPDMKNPLEAAEVGSIIGNLLRLTGKVNRGYGAVRQDVNVSVTGGTRIEIKGVPRLKYIPRLTGFEALRQKALLDLRENVQKRGFNAENDFQYDIMDVSGLIGRISHQPLRDKFPQFRSVKAVRFKGLGGIFGYRLNPGWSFANEVSARIRVIACIDDLPNIAHTDQNDSLSLNYQDASRVLGWFKSDPNDAAVIIWGPVDDVDTAIKETILRVKEILKGIPSETRQYRSSGLTDFERILPGPDRMYPDTDSPPTRITEEIIASISSRLPETPWVKSEKFRQAGLGESVILNLLHSQYLPAFDSAFAEFPQKARLLSKLVLQSFPYLSRKHSFKWENSELAELLKLVCSRNLPKETFEAVLIRSLGMSTWREIFSQMENLSVDDNDIETQIRETIPSLKPPAKKQLLVGVVKSKLPPVIDGGRIAKLIEKYL